MSEIFNNKNLYDSITLLAESFKNTGSLILNDLNNDETALIIVDVVNGFIKTGAMSCKSIEKIVPNISVLMKKCLNLNIPVIAFADSHSEKSTEFSDFPCHCVEGTHETEIVDELKQISGYTLIKKNSTNGFHTDAFREFVLNNPNITSYIVTGDCTDICVLQLALSIKTYYNDKNIKSSLYIPINCVDTYNSTEHNKEFFNLTALKIAENAGIKVVKEVI